MHCNGKCHLSKQLAQARETGDAQNQKGVSPLPPSDYCEEISQYNFSLSIQVSQSFVTVQAAAFPAGYKSNVFHPPAPLV
jgi:hypothetical protein